MIPDKKEYNKKYGVLYRQKNKEKIKESNRKYRCKNKGKIKELLKKYAASHIDELKEYNHIYYQKNKTKLNEKCNKEEIKKSQEEYRISHREEIRQKRHTDAYRKRNRIYLKIRRAKKRASIEKGGDFSKKEWEDLLLEFNSCCAYCGIKTDRLEIEHIIPISKNGLNNISNIVPACKSCNTRKGSKSLLLWILEN